MKQVEIDKGMSLWSAVAKAKEAAYEEGYGIVQIIFNNVKLLISEDSQDGDIAEIYRLKRKCGEYEK